MVDIYTQPELYDAIHKKYEWDKSLLISSAKITGGPVLELAAGTGRLTQLIVELGFDYTGIDTSQEFLSFARDKYKTYGNKVQFLHGDMRDFKLAQKFRFVFIGFNSFLHLLINEDAAKCLQCIYNHLTRMEYYYYQFLSQIPVFCTEIQISIFPKPVFLNIMDRDAE